MIKYMNGSVFSTAKYMNGVGSEILARTLVPKLPLVFKKRNFGKHVKKYYKQHLGIISKFHTNYALGINIYSYFV